MKKQMFFVFVSVLGLVFLLALTATIQGAGEQDTNEILSTSVFVNSEAGFNQVLQPSVGLGYTSPITFTPAYTVYLSSVMRHWSLPAPAPASTTRFANHTSHPIIYLTVDGVQYFVQSPQGILPGYYYEIELTPGDHTYEAMNGWWDGPYSRFEMYGWTGSFTQQKGVVGTIDFYDPTIEQLLADFSTSAYWGGYYWQDVVYHDIGFCFYDNGTWNLYIDGTYDSSGTYSLVSRDPGTMSVKFTVGDYIGTLYELFGFFYMRNGPPDWPLIEYYIQRHITCP